MILLNDASLHGQFEAFEQFRLSLKEILHLRSLIKSEGRTVNVCRSIRQRPITENDNFNDFLGSLRMDQRAQLLVWIDREGPFWDDIRQHCDTEYFECLDEPVTDTALAEAAQRVHDGEPNIATLSFAPSRYSNDRLQVFWRDTPEGDRNYEVPNFWTEEQITPLLAALETEPASWDELLDWCSGSCPGLLLSPDLKRQLGSQFFPHIAKRARVLFSVLQSIAEAVAKEDEEAFNSLRAQWMEGKYARFTPSSTTELRECGKKLTFKHPETGSSVVCSWHGKIRSQEFRIHFEWPPPKGFTQVFVAYFGPKLTKK